MKCSLNAIRMALGIAAVCALPGIARAQSQPATYAITHAEIFTLAGSTIEDGTLIFRDGKITAVGAGIDIPAGA